MTDVTVRAYALRWSDTSVPGWLEVEFEDADGRLHQVVEKEPVLSARTVGIEATFPFELPLRCALVEARDETVTVTLAYGLTTTEGLTTIVVPRHSVEQFTA